MIGLPYMVMGATVAIAIAGASGFAAGWRAKDVRCDLAEAKQNQATLEHNILMLQENVKRQEKVIEEDNAAAAHDAATILALEGKANELQGKISSGLCFTADDVDRLRNLFGPGPGDKRQAPARSGSKGRAGVLPGPDRPANAR